MLRRNVLANVLGGSWWAALSLLIIPFQVRVLGVEAYGLLAFLASVQILLSIFDFGLSPAITRAVTMDASTDLVASGRLAGIVSVGYAVFGICLGLLLIASSGWLAGHWLHLERLPVQTVATAIRLGGVAIALRWPVSFLSGAIAGRQRFDLLNLLRAGVASFAVVGGIGAILVTHDLLAYLTWMAVSAAVEVAAYAAITVRLLPSVIQLHVRSLTDARSVFAFAAGINLINLLSMLLTQSDRLLISKVLGIQSLGYYALAYNIVFGLTLIQTFVTSAMFPAFVSSHSSDDQDRFRSRYRDASQALMYVYNFPIWLLIFFGIDLLGVLSTPATAAHSAPILSVLALGFLCNSSAALAYTASIASGRTRLPIVVNVVAVIFYIPLLAVLTLRWAGLGAAIAWLVLNLFYLPTLLLRVHRTLLGIATLDWLRTGFLPFVLLGLACFGSAKLGRILILPDALIANAALGAIAGIAYLGLGFRLLRPSLRAGLQSSVAEIRRGFIRPGGSAA